MRKGKRRQTSRCLKKKMISQINIILTEWKRKSYFLVCLSFVFKSFLILLLSFPPFSIFSLSFFLWLIVQSQSRFVLSLLLLLLNHLSLFILSYSLFCFFFLYLFVLSYSILSVICLCKLFSLWFIWNIVLFSVLPFAFSISQSCYFVFDLFYSFKTCSRSHSREIRTNMHDKGTKRNECSC